MSLRDVKDALPVAASQRRRRSSTLRPETDRVSLRDVNDALRVAASQRQRRSSTLRPETGSVATGRERCFTCSSITETAAVVNTEARDWQCRYGTSTMLYL